MKNALRKMFGAGVLLIAISTARIGLSFYDPSTGRWLTRDPLGEPGFQVLRVGGYAGTATSPGHWINRDPVQGSAPGLAGFETTAALLVGGPNRYLFVGNNPVNETDPLGLASPEEIEQLRVAAQQAQINLAAAQQSLVVAQNILAKIPLTSRPCDFSEFERYDVALAYDRYKLMTTINNLTGQIPQLEQEAKGAEAEYEAAAAGGSAVLGGYLITVGNLDAGAVLTGAAGTGTAIVGWTGVGAAFGAGYLVGTAIEAPVNNGVEQFFQLFTDFYYR